MPDHDPNQITAFWFGTLSDGLADDAHRRAWFKADAERDAGISRRFAALLERAAAGELDHWLDSIQGTLAYILLCDQLSRQIHRGTAAAYATDARALSAARSVVAGGADTALAFDKRAFIYMPFQHAESRLDQHTSVGLFDALREDTDPAQRHHADGFLQHAREHRDIVARFGRFPHRNALLDRPSSAAELDFLRSAGNFGQAPVRAADQESPPRDR
ncbi:MAG: DUF924 family protein [Gammaproteobacteria bacterium]|nr:DUF924 family protein [Gammaproteobacteria bacterium]